MTNEFINKNFSERLKDLRFHFKMSDCSGYQIILQIIIEIIESGQYENYKNEIFDNIEILDLIYGWNDILKTSKFQFEIDKNKWQIKSPAFWIYILLSIFNNKNVSNDMLIIIKEALAKANIFS